MAIPTRGPIAGFAMIQGLIVIAVLAVVCVVLLPLFHKGISQEMTNVAVAELDETFMEIATILRRQDTCLLSLGSPSGLTAQNLTIYYSSPIPLSAGPQYLKSGDTKGRITFDNIEIGINTPPTPIGTQTQLGFFRIKAHVTSLGQMPLVREYPIYMLTNAAGTSIASCFITKFSKTDPLTGKKYTIEDQACQSVPLGFNPSVTPNPTAVYDPLTKTCI